MKNCNNLSEINLLDDINDNNFEEFYRKFGPKIKYLPSFRKLNELNDFPNIEKIRISHVTDDSIIAQLKLAKLKVLEIELGQGQENMLQTFIDTFPTLTHFSVSIDSGDENMIYESLKNISNLKHLIHFGFPFQLAINNKQFCDLLNQMSTILQNLKSIDCCFVFIDKNSEIRKFLSQLIAYPALKRLSLTLTFVYSEEELNFDVNQLFSFELFKGFSNITHLSLYSFKWKLNLKDLDINFANLQYLDIHNDVNTTIEVVKEMADILSRLSRLETLKLWFESEVDFSPIEEQIPEKCRKIKEIQLMSEI